ncbi:MAG: NAD(P)-binding domain-containing protein, partial [Acidimicrobiia bacterium]
MNTSDATISGVGFIGGGRIARVILGGWRRAGFFPGEIVVSDPDPDALSQIEALDTGAKTFSDGNALAAAQPFIVLAVHPPVIRTLGLELAPVLRENTVIVSLAPQLTIAALGDVFGGFTRIARAIPNAPSIVGAGYNPVSFAALLSAAALLGRFVL